MSSEPKFYEKYPIHKQFWYHGRLMSELVWSVDHLDEIPKLQVCDSDILLHSFPKCGAHWLDQILSLVANAADMDAVARIRLSQRVPFVEEIRSNEIFELILKDVPRRIYHTHLTPELLPQAFKTRGKIVCLYRNPKDVAVSYFYFYKMHQCFNWYKGSWSEFLQAFIDGHVMFGSYFEYYNKWWKIKDQENIYYITYENLCSDLAGEIRKLCDFLGFSLSEESLEKVLQYASFENMRKDQAINKMDEVKAGILDYENSGCQFLRKGQVNDWKNTFTVRDNEVFEEHIKEQEQEFGVTFPRD